MTENSRKRKTLTTAIAVILAVLIAIGGSTFAYLQAETDDVVNEFAANQVTVDLKESTDGKYNIIPGTSEFKDPAVTVSTTVPAYVYVEVMDNTENLVTYTIADGWLKLEGYPNVYYRELDSAADNAKFEVLKNNTVSYANSITNSDMVIQNDDGTYSLKDGITLSFKALAIQKEPFTDALDAYDCLTQGDKYLSYKEIAAMAFENSPIMSRNQEYFIKMSEHAKSKNSVNFKTFFAIGVNSGKSINITNNSDNQSFSVYVMDSKTTIIDIVPSDTASYTLPSNAAYIALSVTNNDFGTIKPTDVELGNFSISYTDSDKNILSGMKKMAYAYSNNHLKNYDADAIRKLNNNSPWCAHAGGTTVADKRNSKDAIISAIDRGAYVIEMDVRKTADDVLVCIHNENINNSKVLVAETTYSELLKLKSNLLTLEQAINIVKEHSDTVLISFDIKTQDCYDYFYDIIDQNNFKNRIDYSLAIAEHYGITLEKPNAVLCLNGTGDGGNYWYYAVDFLNKCKNGQCTGLTMWELQSPLLPYDSPIFEKHTELALYLLTAYAGDDAFFRRNFMDNVIISLPDNDEIMEMDIKDMLPYRVWIVNDLMDVA